MEQLNGTEGYRLLFAKPIQREGKAESIEPPVPLLQIGRATPSPGPGDGQSVVGSSTARHRRRKSLSPSEMKVKNRGL